MTTTPYRHNLWEYFNKNHNLILLQSELNDIIHACELQLTEELSAVKRERDDARLQLEIETKYREKCVKCGNDWNPSLVESGWCIFCIQRETREERDHLRSVCDELAESLEHCREVLRNIAAYQYERKEQHQMIHPALGDSSRTLIAYNNLPHVKQKSI